MQTQLDCNQIRVMAAFTASRTSGLDKDLTYGDTEIYHEQVLGVGSYGKVCKARCGQLPCAAKLLHDTMFGSNDPGIQQFAKKFKEECRLLRAIKHPNIVQYLDTLMDPKSKRLVLLMELMDESLTKFLERSTVPLSYHIQLNIGHDVALALAYLHSNGIVHRDLSSNNILLIGEGRRAKVTDFGMSKLAGMNPLRSKCPGCSAYMPPEALTTPSHYSSKLDCFCQGVLFIQVATKQFPNPGDAHIRVKDPSHPNRQLLKQVPEIERRGEHINLVNPEHPLLPLALQCLRDLDAERPSANELCERLAVKKQEAAYTSSVEEEQNMSPRTLQQQLQEKEGELERARANHKTELASCHAKLHQNAEKHEQEVFTLQKEIRVKDAELMINRDNYEQELKECQLKLQTACKKASIAIEEYERRLATKNSVINALRREVRLVRKCVHKNFKYNA